MTVSPAPFALHPDRLFPPDLEARDIARRLYASVAGLPILSPHAVSYTHLTLPTIYSV